ncbi:hypothetical protein AAMO2058_001335100 [Amorphochlora amoebiformis]
MGTVKALTVVVLLGLVEAKESGLKCTADQIECSEILVTRCNQFSNKNCADALSCVHGCGDNPPCTVRCLQHLNKDSRDIVRDYFECGQNHHCFPSTTAPDSCTSKNAECSLSPSCKQWRDCVESSECETFDAGCLARCDTKPNDTKVIRELVLCSMISHTPIPYLPGPEHPTRAPTPTAHPDPDAGIIFKCIEERCVDAEVYGDCYSDNNCKRVAHCLIGCGSSSKGSTCGLDCVKKLDSKNSKIVKHVFTCAEHNACLPPPSPGSNASCTYQNQKCSESESCDRWRSCVDESSCDPFDLGCMARCNPNMNTKEDATPIVELSICSMRYESPIHRPEGSGGAGGNDNKEASASGLWIGVSIAALAAIAFGIILYRYKDKFIAPARRHHHQLSMNGDDFDLVNEADGMAGESSFSVENDEPEI